MDTSCIDVTQPGGLLTTGQAARLLPGKPHPTTLLRFILNGREGVRLQAVRVGGRWYTSREALNNFAHECAEARLNRHRQPRKPDADATREARAAAAERELVKAGC